MNAPVVKQRVFTPRVFKKGLLASALTMAAVSAPSYAQSQDAFSLEEIIVTAQKREQSLQDVGIAISAFQGETLEAMGVVNSNEIAAKTPNLTIVSPAGEGGVVSVFIRGIGLNDFALNNTGPVGFYLDGSAIGSTNGQLTTLFDVERVEVLKGPQGTLFGRNTTGGALNIVSNKPTEEFEASVAVSAGNYGYLKTEGVVSGNLAENLNGRLAVVAYESDGYIENTSTGDEVEKQNFAARALFDYQPTDDLSFMLNLRGSRNDSDSDLYGTTLDADFYEGAHGTRDYKINVDTLGASLTAIYDINDNVTLTSLTAYDDLDKFQEEDADMSPLELVELDYSVDTHSFSQELRLNGSTDNTEWIGGLYYLSETTNWSTHTGLRDLPLADISAFAGAPGFPAALDPSNPADVALIQGFGIPVDDGGVLYFGESSGQGKQTLETSALFGQVEYLLSEQWSLTVGARYTVLEVDFDLDVELVNFAFVGLQNGLSFSDDLKNEELSGKIAIDYRHNEDTLYYASVTKGFKGGGFNGGQVSDFANYAAGAEYDPEELLAYELGVKSSLLDGAMRLNAAVFYYDYSDAQVFNGVSDPNTSLPQNVIENADTLDVYGLDMDISWQPIEGLFVQLGVGYTHSEFDQYDQAVPQVGGGVSSVSLSGETPQNSPEWNINFLANYEWYLGDSGSLSAQVDASYQSEVYFTNGTILTPGDNDSYDRNKDVGQDSYSLWNARLAWRSSDEQLEMALWGKNLSDKEYAAYMFELTDLIGADQVMRGVPRTYGVDVKYHF